MNPALKKTDAPDAQKIAETFARRWVDSNIRGYNENKEMFEKYDALHSGQYGGGGEYTVQSGFGWSNGVALSLINSFYINNDNNNIKYRKHIRR
ncbi:hypothetical protein NQ314_020268 [Rhamnusium bicolor]|uniref:Trehalase n=1 Tax=Rhamnusium bicolor TaxID=1586634 RepID=A0AAV8WMB8_9CUCU|nr:hypothetical protein NQ314_020268 [Rhamnusium bicolor]